jgi:predicted Rossmann fold nucleotide-binding protein DprA/Smf involved in DNA uptake
MSSLFPDQYFQVQAEVRTCFCVLAQHPSPQVRSFFSHSDFQCKKKQATKHIPRKKPLSCTFSLPPKTRDELIEQLTLPVQHVNGILTVMELKGLVAEQGGMFRKV